MILNSMIVVIIFILGLIIGSFLNSVIYRQKHGGSIVSERSHCPKCHNKLRWFELIPLVSFIVQKGQCRNCQKNISWQYPLVELATGLLFIVAYYSLNATTISLPLIRDWYIVSILLVIFVYDLKYQLIPDKFTLPAIGLVLIYNLFFSFSVYEFLSFIIAAVVGGGFFLAQFLVSRGKWIGGGDIRLGVLMGVVLGWPNILWALMLAYILGAVVAVGLVMSKHKAWSGAIPFGTFLTLSTFVIMYWGETIVSWYLNMFNL